MLKLPCFGKPKPKGTSTRKACNTLPKIDAEAIKIMKIKGGGTPQDNAENRARSHKDNENKGDAEGGIAQDNTEKQRQRLKN